MTKAGKIKKVGITRNEEGEIKVVESSQVNAFQIRYMRA